jgi:hypothetical protein
MARADDMSRDTRIVWRYDESHPAAATRAPLDRPGSRRDRRQPCDDPPHRRRFPRQRTRGAHRRVAIAEREPLAIPHLAATDDPGHGRSDVRTADSRADDCRTHAGADRRGTDDDRADAPADDDTRADGRALGSEPEVEERQR